MSADQTVDQIAAGIAHRLLGNQAAELAQVHGGGNNRVYRVTQPGHPDLALKLYAPPGTAREDAVARLRREFNGLHFLSANGFTSVPKAVSVDWQDLAALYEWIDGEKLALLAPDDRGAGDIGAAIRFIGDLHALSGTATAPTLFQDTAREACLSSAELLRQVENRLAALSNLAAEPGLQTFMRDVFKPAFAEAAGRLQDWAAAAGQILATDLAAERRILSPSDFGFHNALKRPQAGLTFIDFEYFGWDDPIKLLADFVWHPAMRLSPAERQAFLAANLALLSARDPQILERFNAQFPLYGLRWAAILLNEFFPERWQRRVFAGKGDASPAAWNAAKERQLAQAYRYLQIVQATSKTPARAPLAALLEIMTTNQ